MRVSFESNGQKVCLTSKSVQSPGGMKMHGSQFQESPGIHDLLKPDVGKSAGLENQPTIAPTLPRISTLYLNPLQTIESPPKVPKQVGASALWN